MDELDRVKLKDIADRLQISPGTVSKALSGKKGISDSLRDRISTTAREMGYHVNRTAQCLARKTLRIGITYPTAWSQYYDQLICGMRTALRSLRDYNAVGIFSPFGDIYALNDLSDVVHAFIGQKVDAVILCPGAITHCDALLLELKEQNIPVFLVGNDFSAQLRTACIRVNATLAGALAGELMNYFTPSGAGILAFLGDKSILEHTQKLDGFQRELEDGRRLLACYETRDDTQLAKHLLRKAICEYPDIHGIYVATGNSIPICEALQEYNGKFNHVKLIATDLFDEMMPYVQNRQIRAVIFQDPEMQGQRAVLHCYEYLTKHRLSQECLIEPSVLLRNAILRQLSLNRPSPASQREVEIPI